MKSSCDVKLTSLIARILMLFKIFVSCLAVELHSATLLKCEKLTTAKISLLLPNIHIYIPNHDKPVDCILFNSV